MPDLNTPSPKITLCARGHWGTALVISLLGHSCLAIGLWSKFSPLPPSPTFATRFDMCFLEEIPTKISKECEHKKETTPFVKPKTASSSNPSPLSVPDEAPSLVLSSPVTQPVGSNPPPEYPQEAREKGIEGTVILKANINPKGQILDVKVVPPRASPLLEQAALNAIKRWHFSPFSSHECQEIQIPIHFQLED